MSVNTRIINTSPENVWNVLADGWTYPLWVVGASRVRDVDESWPAVGSLIHHSVGVWPALIDDNSEVLEVDPQRMIRLRARGWPIGEAEVVIELKPSGAHTEVEIREQAVAGPGVLVPEPIKGLTLKWRNTETLRRLAYIAENRPAS
ncbi:SRPBCC family protein [Aeromicrobium sp. SMF47]|uniref:SRPBCC family protein n=1 Tax=Aeromicrobium yanjiei TaxID=2662028 RepID=A0A5Q2MNB4_9ACTN|nr:MULTISPECIES: SRPBCC family protein [Aeromicrobium]MRJ76169.1 SRPBCC family protein [Aeromicrobium yanjiei]MRK00519.1 SRPBCC family protein [Aeromicrobium sp. S22]QGG42642.1 SRPBCC family protein [Aeromicrobium yanjiei]